MSDWPPNGAPQTLSAEAGTPLQVYQAAGRISVRTYNALCLNGIFTVGQLRDLAAADGLWHLRNVGQLAIEEVMASGLLDDNSVDNVEADGPSGEQPATTEEVVVEVRPGAPDGLVDDSCPIAWLVGPERLTIRTANILFTHAIVDVGRLRLLSRDELMQMRGMGPTSLAEIDRVLVLSATAAPPRPDDPDAPTTDDAGLSPPTSPSPTLAELLSIVIARVDASEYQILQLRQSQTLEAVGQKLGVTRERVRQREARAVRTTERLVLEPAARMIDEWRRLFDTKSLVAESELFEPWLHAGADEGSQREFGRILLDAVIPGVRRPRLFGGVLDDCWAQGDEELTSQAYRVAAAGPFTSDMFAAELVRFGFDPALGRRIFELPLAPLLESPEAHGWVRREARLRDACFLVLRRHRRPASANALARMLSVDTPRNVAAHLERDERFRRLYAQRAWALTEWGDLGDGTRFRTTRDALLAILHDCGPIDEEALVERVRAAHPVSPWAVRNALEDRDFGRFADGRIGLTADGAVPHEDDEPMRTPEVDGPHHDGSVSMILPVTAEMLRGSGLPAPRWVAWYLDLRTPPVHRTFQTRTGADIALTRAAGAVSISSLRREAVALQLDVGCNIRVTLAPADGSASVEPACPCHRPVHP